MHRQHPRRITDRHTYDLRASFASRANACHASGLTIAQLLGHANSTQILPTYVKPLDENTRAVINALDTARTLQSTFHLPFISLQWLNESEVCLMSNFCLPTICPLQP